MAQLFHQHSTAAAVKLKSQVKLNLGQLRENDVCYSRPIFWDHVRQRAFKQYSFYIIPLIPEIFLLIHVLLTIKLGAGNILFSSISFRRRNGSFWKNWNLAFKIKLHESLSIYTEKEMCFFSLHLLMGHGNEHQLVRREARSTNQHLKCCYI